MLIRKAAFLASLLASVFGARSAEAGIFGKRNCCQATPIVCPPSAPADSGYLSRVSQPPTCVESVQQTSPAFCQPSPMSEFYAPQAYIAETRSRMVNVTKWRSETRTRTVCRDGQAFLESYTVRVPYTELVAQSYTVQVPVTSTSDVVSGDSVPRLLTEFIHEDITIAVENAIKTIRIKIPANVTESEKVAFRDLFRQVSEALTGVEVNVNKIENQQETLDKHGRIIENLP